MYLWMKWVHILSSTLLMGTGLGIAFFMWVAHLRGELRQIRARDLAVQALAEGVALPPAYHQAMRWWFLLGCPAFIAVVVIFWLMVMKPG